jgi:thymidine kinase
MAQIEIIIGPMFSGKSTELIRRCRNYEAIEKKVLIFNHSLDTRCETNVVQTHSKCSKTAVKTDSLCIQSKKIEDFDVVAIDEAQFFPDLFDFVKQIEHFDIVLIIAGLDGDCFRKPFGQILQCIPYANDVTKLHAMCMIKKDGTYASFTKRLDSIEPQTGQVDIGAQDKYMAVCRSMYLY